MQADPAFTRSRRQATINCMGVTTAGSDPGTEVVKHRPARAGRLHPRLPCAALGRGASGSRLGSDTWSSTRRIRAIRRSSRPALSLTAPNNPANRKPGQQDLRQGAGTRRGGRTELPLSSRAAAHNFTLHFNNSIGALKEGHGSNWLQRHARRRPAPARSGEEPARHRLRILDAVVGQHGLERLARRTSTGRRR